MDKIRYNKKIKEFDKLISYYNSIKDYNKSGEICRIKMEYIAWVSEFDFDNFID